MSQLKVNALRNTSASSDSITLASNADITLSNVPLLKPGTYTTSGRPADPTDGTFIYNSDDKEMQYFCDDAGWRNFKNKGYDLKSIIDDIGGEASTYLHWCCDGNSAGMTGAKLTDLSGNGWDGTNYNMSYTAPSGSTGGYWVYNSDSGNSYSDLGTQLGSTIGDDTSQFAVCAWIYCNNFEDMPDNQYWIMNDGDWSPDGQIGFRLVENSTSGTTDVRCAAGDDNFSDSSDNASTGWPTGAGWAFVGAVRTGNQYASSDERFQNVKAFPTDTNIDHFKDLTGKGFASHNASYGIHIGNRPDSPSDDNREGDRLGMLCLWLKTSGTTPMNNPITWMETIFDKTKGRYT